MSKPHQPPLPLLTTDQAMGRDAFFPGAANALALALVEGWRDWPGRKLMIQGPEASGKTHLAHLWQDLTGARIIAATDLPALDIPTLATAPLCVEDIHRIAGQRPLEEALFHLHNLAFAEAQPLLLTARGAPGHWPLVLPDLKSRLMAVQAASIDAPDDALLTALLAKMFGDRNTVPAPDVIPFLVKTMPRSFAAARDIVEQLDAMALARPGGVTRPLASKFMAAYTEKTVEG